MIRAITCGLCVLAVGALASTADARKKTKDGQTLVCKMIETTGWRVSTTRVCLTAAQWLEAGRKPRELADEMQAQRSFDYDQDRKTAVPR